MKTADEDRGWMMELDGAMDDYQFETERLRLCRWRDEFADEILRLNADPEVMRYVGYGKALPVESSEAAETLQRHSGEMARGDGLGLWAVVDKATERFLGWAGLFEMPMAPDEIELGYRYNKFAWGQGFASEAAAVFLPHAFEVLDLAELRAVTYPENTPSRRILEKLGFTCRGFCDYRGVSATDYRLARESYLAAKAPRQ